MIGNTAQNRFFCLSNFDMQILLNRICEEFDYLICVRFADCMQYHHLIGLISL